MQLYNLYKSVPAVENCGDYFYYTAGVIKKGVILNIFKDVWANRV
jgi:hypothetical protein